MYTGTEVSVSVSQTAWAQSWQLTLYRDEGKMSGSIAPHPHMSSRRAQGYRHLYPCFSTVIFAAVFPSFPDEKANAILTSINKRSQLQYYYYYY